MTEPSTAAAAAAAAAAGGGGQDKTTAAERPPATGLEASGPGTAPGSLPVIKSGSVFPKVRPTLELVKLPEDDGYGGEESRGAGALLLKERVEFSEVHSFSKHVSERHGMGGVRRVWGACFAVWIAVRVMRTLIGWCCFFLSIIDPDWLAVEAGRSLIRLPAPPGSTYFRRVRSAHRSTTHSEFPTGPPILRCWQFDF